MDSVIYYFSGTGNSYKIAKNISEGLGDTKIIRITSENMKLAEKSNYKKVGIVFPVYFFALPKMVIEFVEKLRIDPESYIYAVATCGGFAGISLLHMEKLFKEKAYLNLSTFKILMPDNYQVLYSPSSMERQEKVINESNIKAKEIVPIINKEEIHNEKEPNILYQGVGELGYKIFKPKYKDNNFWVDEDCNGCKICERVCPANDIVMKDNKPQWLNNCEQCLACMQWCPEKAIQYKKSTINRGRYTHPEVKVNEVIIKKGTLKS